MMEKITTMKTLQTMNKNKLYTEEQVKVMIDDAHNGVDGYYDILKNHNPIELPSDEEIEEKAKKVGGGHYPFICGAKWVINKIQGGNND
jgi:hypothetical protein